MILFSILIAIIASVLLMIDMYVVEEAAEINKETPPSEIVIPPTTPISTTPKTQK